MLLGVPIEKYMVLAHVTDEKDQAVIIVLAMMRRKREGTLHSVNKDQRS